MLMRTLVCTALALAVIPAAAQAQQPAPPAATQGASTIKRTPLQKFDIPGTNYETITGLAEITGNSMIGAHTHSGLEAGYLLEGEMVLMIAGQPDRPMKAGDSYQIPAGAVHDGKSGAAGAKVIATYTVEKGKPFAVPAAK
jgi:quercetin dioxygenase-like cupin family protein